MTVVFSYKSTKNRHKQSHSETHESLLYKRSLFVRAYIYIQALSAVSRYGSVDDESSPRRILMRIKAR